VSLREDIVTAVKRFRLVEPVTLDDMQTIATHLRFALGGDAKVEVFRNTSSTPIIVGAWRSGEVAAIQIAPFTSTAEATKARDSESRSSSP
jgi:hypothetical protein